MTLPMHHAMRQADMRGRERVIMQKAPRLQHANESPGFTVKAIGSMKLQPMDLLLVNGESN